ncbi:MAG: peptide ABC transporter permease [Planctomycetes bacterium]|nr:peptide ABC transporter permease [Planctomycetota bacterium]
MMQRWSFRLALGFLLTLAVLAALAPWLPLADPSAIDPDARLQAPAWIDGPVLGTDAKGRDLLARVIYGARISLTVGLLGSLVAILIGLPYGALAGMRGGRTDRFLMRLADLFEGIPLAVVIVFLLSVLQAYRGELAAIGLGRIHVFFLAVGALFWLPTARIARAEALRLRTMPFVEAAQTAGLGGWGLMRRHYLPNLLPSALVMLGLTLPRVVLMEAFLSFLGLGVEAPHVSWGLLAADGLAAMNPLVDSGWLLGVPAAFLALTLLCLNVLADAARDRLAGRRVRQAGS